MRCKTSVDAGADDKIRPQQEAAIALLAQGKSLAETAEAVGVDRSTLYRWTHNDAAFIAAWNAWRKLKRQTVRAQLLGMTGAAVEVVRGAIEQGDAKLAFSLLKEMALTEPEAEGSSEATVVQRQADIERRKENVAMGRVESDLLMDEKFYGG